MNLAALAQDQAERLGSQMLALIDDQPVSYGRLADSAARMASGLRALGVEPGDRVAVMMATRPEFYAWFGIFGAGAIEVPIHDAARGPGISYILETTGARVLVVDEEHVEHVAEHIGSVATLEHVIITGQAPTLGKPAHCFESCSPAPRRSRPPRSSLASRPRFSSQAAPRGLRRASCCPTTTT